MNYNPLNLSKREIEVARLISESCSTKEIALRLGIAIRTVCVHRLKINRRLKAKSVIDIYKYTINHLQEDTNE